MSTKIYGRSDDLVEIEGDITDEVGYYDEEEKYGTLLACSDGTMLDVSYGKGPLAVWAIAVLRKGDLFVSHTVCNDEDANPYSDVVEMADGLKWIIAATKYTKIK